MIDFLDGADWLTAALAFMAVFLGALSLVLVAELVRGWWVQRTVRSRLSPMVSGQEASGGLLRDDEHHGAVDKVVNQFSDKTGLGSLLRQSDSTWSVPAFLFISFALAAGTGVASTLVTVVTIVVPKGGE